MQKIFFMTFVSAVLSSCTVSSQSSTPTAVAFSEGYQEQLNAEEQAKSSFDARDLSGCWQPVSIFPHSGLYGSPFVFKKIQENEYQTTQKDADGIMSTERVMVSDTSFEYRLNNGAPQRGELLFDAYPYQLKIISEESPDAFEVAQQYGFQWLGKTCPP